MRVAHVVNSLTKASGISFFCAHMAQHLAELGVDVDLYVRWVGDDALLPVHERIRIHETQKAEFNPIIRPDIVHVHALWEPMAHQGCVYARSKGVPYVVSPHGMLTPWALRNRWWKKIPALCFYQYLDLLKATMLHATAVSEVVSFRRIGLKTDVSLVPLATNIPALGGADLRAKSIDSVNFNDYSENSQKTRRVLFLSRIHPVKGLLNLISAWAILKGEGTFDILNHDNSCTNTRWQLIIAGPDADGYKQTLIDLAQSLQLGICDISEEFDLSRLKQTERSADIVFTGPVYGKDKDDLHRWSDLFVLPSFSENFGAVVADSLAYGVPVITTKGTPWEELEGNMKSNNSSTASQSISNEYIDSGRCGWWIDIGVEPLVNALGEAIGMNEKERQKLGDNGRRLIEKKYTWPVVSAEMKLCYERALGFLS